MTDDVENLGTPPAPDADQAVEASPEPSAPPIEATAASDTPVEVTNVPEAPATSSSAFALPPIAPASDTASDTAPDGPASPFGERYAALRRPTPTEPAVSPGGGHFPVLTPPLSDAPDHDTAPLGPAPTSIFLPPSPVPAVDEGPPKENKGKRWIAVAVIAAVIGALVGSGVTALTDNHNNNGPSVTIHESNAAPGAAVLSGNVSIPQLVKKVIPAVVSIDVKAGGEEDEGTGMIITSNGEVITNNHVIELYTGTTGGSITVTEYGQTKANPATLIGYDATKDVALLKINSATKLQTVTFGSSAKTQVGDAVVAIGNALGLAAGTPTVTQGIVSALGRSVTAGGDGTASENLQNLVQTDAAINPGNSGGPLIDTAGQVIGMNTAVAGTSDNGTSSQNIGFAIPIAQVESLIPELEKGGPASNQGGYLGVDITTLTPALRQQYGFTPTSGAVVLTVISGSPADKAGIQQGDVIVDIGGTAIDSSEKLQSVVQNDKAGQVVSVTYYVGNEKHTTSVTLGNQAQAQQEQSQQQSSSSTDPFGGGGFSGGSSDGTLTIP